MLSRHHQVALLDDALEHVLVVPTDDGPRLPRHPDRWPGHRDLTAVVGAPRALLAGPPWREDDGTVTHVLLGTRTADGDASWHPLDGLEELGLSAASVAGLRRTVRERLDGPPDDGRAAWFRPGWLELVDAWVQEVLPLHGLVATGPADPVRLWSLSAVLTYPVQQAGGPADPRVVWFKATCEGFHDEPALTQAIAGLAPEIVPRVLAVEPDRAWMLMEEIPGADGGTAHANAPDVARALARLQLDTLAERDVLLAAGLPDRGLEATLAGMRLCLHESVEAPRMSPELRDAALEIEPWLEEQLRTFWSSGLPDALNHADLHLGNVAWSEGRPVLFDWTDACLTHPFLDAKHLADSAKEEGGGEEARVAVWEAYAEPWRAAFPDVDLDAVWSRVREAEAVFQMVSYEHIYRAQPEGSRWELATIVVQILEALVKARREASPA